MRPLFALAVLAALAPAAPVPKAAKKLEDKQLLVGTWKVTLLDGKNLNFHTHTYIFDADGGVKTLFGNMGAASSSSEWTFTLDPDASPKGMKWTSRTKGGGGFECVYELDGDTLKLGFVTGAKQVPAKLEPTAGLTLYEMTREQPAK